MKPRPVEVAMLRSQGALNLLAFGLFVAGRVTDSDSMSLVGFTIFVLLDVIQLVVGLLTPAGGFITVLIAIAGSAFFSPWWLGLGWYFTAMGGFGIPRSLMQVLNPVGMWQRHILPRLPPMERFERMRETEW